MYFYIVIKTEKDSLNSGDIRDFLQRFNNGGKETLAPGAMAKQSFFIRDKFAKGGHSNDRTPVYQLMIDNKRVLKGK
jgi:hypothetical protein